MLLENKDFEDQLWKFAGMRTAKNLLSDKAPYNIWRPKEFERWLKKGSIQHIEEDTTINCSEQIYVLLKGEAVSDNLTKIKEDNVLTGNNRSIEKKVFVK